MVTLLVAIGRLLWLYNAPVYPIQFSSYEQLAAAQPTLSDPRLPYQVLSLSNVALKADYAFEYWQPGRFHHGLSVVPVFPLDWEQQDANYGGFEASVWAIWPLSKKGDKVRCVVACV